MVPPPAQNLGLRCGWPLAFPSWPAGGWQVSLRGMEQPWKGAGRQQGLQGKRHCPGPPSEIRARWSWGEHLSGAAGRNWDREVSNTWYSCRAEAGCPLLTRACIITKVQSSLWCKVHAQKTRGCFSSTSLRPAQWRKEPTNLSCLRDNSRPYILFWTGVCEAAFFRAWLKVFSREKPEEVWSGHIIHNQQIDVHSSPSFFNL